MSALSQQLKQAASESFDLIRSQSANLSEILGQEIPVAVTQEVFEKVTAVVAEILDREIPDGPRSSDFVESVLVSVGAIAGDVEGFTNAFKTGQLSSEFIDPPEGAVEALVG